MKTLHKDPSYLISFVIFTMIAPLALTQKEITLNAVMKSAKPTRNDEYLCSSHKLPANEELYITQYEALADAGRAHHILLFGCDEPAVQDQTWHCGRICKSQEQILFAWAKNAPPLKLPKDVGFRVGSNTQIKYIVVQVHYVNPLPAGVPFDNSGISLKLTSTRQRYLAGIYLLLAYSVAIPGNREKIHADISCQFKASGPIYPFGYRTHAHGLGRVITGYQVNGTYHQIGKGNPQWPQAFYPVTDKIVIKPLDYLVGRCTYNSTGRSRSTYIGATANDEMCNFYIMFYMDPNTRLQYHSCAGNNIPSMIRSMPADADVPLPPNPALEEAAHGHHGHMGNPEGHDGDVKTTPKPTPAPTTAKPTTEKLDIGNVIDDILSDNKYIHPNALTRNRDLVNQDNFYQQESDGMYPREFIPDYNMNDYYNEMENQRARKRFHSAPYVSRPVYQHRPQYNRNSNDNIDYYDNDDEVGGYPFIEKDPNLSTSFKGRGSQASSRRNRNHNRNKVQDQSVRGRGRGRGRLINHNNIDDHSDQRNKMFEEAYAISLDKQKSTLTVKDPHPLVVTKATKIRTSHMVDFDSDFVHGTDGSPTSGSNDEVIGQVGGVAVDKNGNVYVFHRGTRVWNGLSFNARNEFQQPNQPINANCIIIYNKDGKVIRKFGSNMFFMPHGISVDDNNNIWVTDVALHQVMRFPENSDTPDIILGTRFKPGNDENHFCKPTDIVILKSGELFISDGYCNSRIARFDSSGKYLGEFGREDNSIPRSDSPPIGTFEVPHSLALAEDKGLLCVADRENGRIQCFDLEGQFQKEIRPPEFGTRLFAVSYCPLHGGLLFAVNGPAFSSDVTVQGFIIDINNGELIETWNAQPGLQNPHDIEVDPINNRVYVGELDPTKVWRFDMKADDHSGSIFPVYTTTHGMVTVNTSEPIIEDTKKSVLPEEDQVLPAIIIGALLVIPVIIIIVVVVVIRVYRKGQYNCCGQYKSRSRKKFNLGNFLSPHRGFDRLSQDESDTEFDPLNDSDEEEYTITRKA